MAKNKHWVALPDGEIVTRNSASRKYSHCVAYQVDGQKCLELEKARKICASVRSNFAYYTAFLDGSSQWLKRKPWDTDESYAAWQAADIAKAIKALDGAQSAEEWFAANKAKQVAKYEADIAGGVYDRWHLAGWCGRADLAAKLAASTKSELVREVIILPAQLKE